MFKLTRKAMEKSSSSKLIKFDIDKTPGFLQHVAALFVLAFFTNHKLPTVRVI